MEAHQCAFVARRKKRNLGDLMLWAQFNAGIRKIRSGVTKNMRGRATQGGRAHARMGKNDKVVMQACTIDVVVFFDNRRSFFKTLLCVRASLLRSLFGLMSKYCREA